MSGLVSGDPDVPGQVFVSDLYSAQCLLLPDDSWGAGAVVTCLQITCDERRVLAIRADEMSAVPSITPLPAILSRPGLLQVLTLSHLPAAWPSPAPT